MINITAYRCETKEQYLGLIYLAERNFLKCIRMCPYEEYAKDTAFVIYDDSDEYGIFPWGSVEASMDTKFVKITVKKYQPKAMIKTLLKQKGKL